MVSAGRYAALRRRYMSDWANVVTALEWVLVQQLLLRAGVLLCGDETNVLCGADALR
jgi:hypothetical protein